MQKVWYQPTRFLQFPCGLHPVSPVFFQHLHLFFASLLKTKFTATICIEKVNMHAIILAFRFTKNVEYQNSVGLHLDIEREGSSSSLCAVLCLFRVSSTHAQNLCVCVCGNVFLIIYLFKYFQLQFTCSIIWYCFQVQNFYIFIEGCFHQILPLTFVSLLGNKKSA